MHCVVVAERRSPGPRGSISHHRAELDLCAPPVTQIGGLVLAAALARAEYEEEP